MIVMAVYIIAIHAACNVEYISRKSNPIRLSF